ncbi:cytochrome c biogenesis heme-transporting ATPase CcmA [Photobacterium leiognathi]|uniref:Cytochrome c biogenesis heme-transporting ATPase CcmA n=1 Tax=Photobacterium leiognathi subsp. mandapamensis TaxID=48408 RepID=A0A2T3L0F3_PHOLD|nr:cytochrome c biogenesis heme-transporting ATPase CcmA [Photobacterium leiognathi]PSV03621.1 cytochrome c biogenesis heme-transporting ATPase CcmA [Photobacterium leiognathi subsp. mandapamensis]PSV13839.1 cytochrome c biogenesis heme-transporting ATPase CcmA [Photobacterium leiognathi subsp. mandapamensis]PSW45616.1 cytochrome c biogenesis heme-transporting ATPase CcmA [Photobacterium leiognathi subsp. mandapamensis]PSW54448.1 cytochrome c biogenesis heme-transporting ATPase CcmA [Photobacte
MLSVADLSCVRDERLLFDELSFTISSGELVQIEGHNGAGKTTLLRIIAGLGRADSGQVFWNQEDIHTAREDFHQELLFLGHQTGVKRELTAFENLAFFQAMHKCNEGSDLKGSPKVTGDDALWQALAHVGLAGREDVPAGQLSAGQQRRVALARLWLSNHKLWVLDEPLTAIDKQGVKVLENLFLSHVERGGMVLLTTHQDMFTDSNHLRKIKLGQ